MKFKVTSDNQFFIKSKEEILTDIMLRRKVLDLNALLNVDSRSIEDYNLYDNMAEGFELIQKALSSDKPIVILVD